MRLEVAAPGISDDTGRGLFVDGASAVQEVQTAAEGHYEGRARGGPCGLRSGPLWHHSKRVPSVMAASRGFAMRFRT
jgi:hypothetical protein